MKLTVIGAGSIGSAIAYDLTTRDAVTLVKVCDARARPLQELHDAVQSPKLRSFQVDVRDPNVLESVLRGTDGAIACVPSHLNPNLARLCVEMGIDYFDLGGSEQTVRRQLELDDLARKKQVWVVPNCGLAPGLINILCLHGVEQFDEVDAAHLRVGDVPLHPEPPFNFRISWSAEKVIDDYTTAAPAIENGEIVQVEPLTHDERIVFDAPFGEMEAFCTAGGLSTLTESLVGRVRRLDYKTIRWPGHASQMRFLLGLGFGEKRSIDVRTHLTYRDLLVRRFRQRLGGEYEDAVVMRVLIKGVQGGKRRTLVYEMVDTFNPEQQLSAMKRCTSIPAATVACLVASKQVPGGGAAPPEHVVPYEPFLQMIAESGLRVTRHWFDGYVEVTDPRQGVAVEEPARAEE